MAQSSTAPPATNVSVAEAKPEKWNDRIKAIGSLVAYQGVDLTSEVSGIVNKINFKSGQQVKSGDVLLSLNGDIELSAVNAAKAQRLSAKSQYKRTKKLKGKKFVSEFELDDIRSKLDVAESSLQQAVVALDKKTIKAPFSGNLGITNVDVGDYVFPGNKIVTLQDVDKLYLDFNLPERFYKDIIKGQTVRFEVRSYPEQIFEGKVIAWDPMLHATTRNVKLRALVENQDKKLAPGMFAEINLVSNKQKSVLVIPETAVFYNIYGEAVYVLSKPKSKDDTANTPDNEKNKKQEYILESSKVEVLYRQDGVAGVIKGLMPQDLVVTSGQLKLYPGLKVHIGKEEEKEEEEEKDNK